jgi:hypothetical protein
MNVEAMEKKKRDKELYFSIDDRVQGDQLSLNNLSLPIIAELVESVTKFIKGSSTIDLSDVKVLVKDGSLAIAVPLSRTIEPVMADFDLLKNTHRLEDIDPKRAKVIADWQERVRKNPSRSYSIADDSDAASHSVDKIIINKDSDYRMAVEDQWVQTETYLYGKVFDMGGKNKPNVHLAFETGGTVTLDAEEELLADDADNHLYKNRLVRIKAEQNLRTNELRKESLVSFEKYAPRFDDNEFLALSAKVKSLWADVPDIVAWVEDVRGNYAQAT